VTADPRRVPVCAGCMERGHTSDDCPRAWTCRGCGCAMYSAVPPEPEERKCRKCRVLWAAMQYGEGR
jgi:hypothetical protein